MQPNFVFFFSQIWHESEQETESCKLSLLVLFIFLSIYVIGLQQTTTFINN